MTWMHRLVQLPSNEVTYWTSDFGTSTLRALSREI